MSTLKVDKIWSRGTGRAANVETAIVTSLVRFTCTSTPVLGLQSNISSVVRVGPGQFRVTWSSPYVSNNYLPMVSMIEDSSISSNNTTCYVRTIDTTNVLINVRGSDGNLIDANEIMVTAYGEVTP